MRIAILLENENFIGGTMVQAYAFNVEDDVITSFAEELLAVNNIYYLVCWLLGKNIKEIFVKRCDERLKDYLKKIDVSVRTLDEIKDNPILKKFVL